jgi:hypothetical protein
MRVSILAAAVVSLLPAMASAQNYRAINNLTVVPLSATNFEVIEGRGEGPRGIWCAAAEFAERRLSASGRIYVLEGRGPSQVASGRTGVVFTTDVSALPQQPSQSVVVRTSQVGMGLPINHAIQFCRDVYDGSGIFDAY